MNKDKLVEVEELWVESKDGIAHAIAKDGKKMKCIAVLVNGKPTHLEENTFLYITHMKSEEVPKLVDYNTNKESEK